MAATTTRPQGVHIWLMAARIRTLPASIAPVIVGTSLAGYVPLVAKQAQFVLLGGVVVGPNTLLRWYVLHVLALPFVLVIFLAVHFWRIRKDGGISGPL